jgi:hypothetical protein
VTAVGVSVPEVSRGREDAVTALLGRLDWVRWRCTDDHHDDHD